MILYKYTDIMTALEIIINSTIKFTYSTNLNDPFEISTCYFGESDNTNLMLQNTYGVLSLTRTPLNPIMWSTYASGIKINHNDTSEHYLTKVNLLKMLDKLNDKCIRRDRNNKYHTGMVFGIDCDIAKLNSYDNVLPAKYGNVIYTKTKPIFDYSDTKKLNLLTNGIIENFDINSIELLQNVFLYKSSDWSYEEEVRVIRNIFRQKIKNGIVPIDRAAIKEVYIGYRNAYSSTYIDEFSKIIEQYIPNCKIYLCRRSNESWSFTKKLLYRII